MKSETTAPVALNGARIEPRALVAVCAQLALVLLVLYQFRIQSESGLTRLAPLIFCGFIIHALLPPKYRLAFFVALSVGCIALLFTVAATMWLLALGLILIGLCHLPLSFRTRVAFLVVAGAGLACVRADLVACPAALVTILPILGSMFMFRLVLYMMELYHEPKSSSVVSALSYFFLLPNICFPLFPLVDYKTFRQTYYNDDAYSIYQTGVYWVLAGTTHLLLYRLVNHYWAIDATQVRTRLDVAHYLLSDYPLYLQVSGQFHLAIGLLHLFGFNLPRTHRLYFFASGFADLWRRLNIYWKDFMRKVFYYPIAFRLMRLGPAKSMTIATVLVFVASWVMHSYQWFWLRGTFPLTIQDGVFWGVFGVMVARNAFVEAKSGRLRRPPSSRKITPTLVARTAFTFVATCVLWSIWSTPSLGLWWRTVQIAL